jgi:Icc protein
MIKIHPENIKIGQISDLHIGKDEELVQGIDVRKNFIIALEAMEKENLDLLVLSGDLSDDGNIGAYEFVSQEMSQYKKPWCFIPGNHDNVHLMNQIFNIESDIRNGEYYYKKEIHNKTIFFLDSSSNSISSEQLEWFKKEAKKEDKEFLLFIHHPPCIAGHRFMDAKYALQNIDEVQHVLNQFNQLQYIFSGHYHSILTAEFGNKKVYICPSTQMLIDEFTPYFCLKSTRPSWRIIEWGDDFFETKVFLY